jgi:sialidase-1
MIQLRDGTILCSSYAWAPISDPAFQALKQPVSRSGGFAFLGGFILRSRDGGASWDAPIFPPPCQGEARRDIFGKLIPAYNRGAMAEGNDGKLYWVVASSGADHPGRTANHLLVSTDQGSSWRYSSVVARDEKVQFNEASIHETPRGDLVAFLRTADFADETCIARSTDRGQTFEWKTAGFKGHPHQALRLPDNRVLLVYGYRHRPFGVRARILNAECTNAAEAPEIILRDDGGNEDLGYPWAVLVSDRRALVVYYFNQTNGPREIIGTFLDLDP